MSETVTATIRYARGDSEALQTEKAYILNYQTPVTLPSTNVDVDDFADILQPGIPKSNFTIDFFPDIQVNSLRTANLNYDDNGLTIAKLRDCMPKEDFDNEDLVEKVYLPEVHRCIREALGVEEVYVFDYMIRKREPAFPYQSTTKENAPQPALSAHIDYTTNEIKGRVEKYFKERTDEFKRRPFQIINVWKPLAGPLRDYPMAYCDAKSMDPETDLLCVDEVFPKVANEVYQVLHNANHRWYYIPDQLDTEVAIFSGYDSRKGQSVAVPHCSFDLGEASSGEPRQSIEVRAFIFLSEDK